MASEKTTELQLNIWKPTDNVSMSEFNENFQKIDSGIVATEQKIDNEIQQVTQQLAQTEQKNKVQGLVLKDYQHELGGAVVFITDDAWKQDYLIFKDIFARHNAPCCTGVIANRIGQANMATLTQLKELESTYGWEMLSHSSDHLRLTEVDDATAENEIINSYHKLRGLGLNVNNFAIPYGYFTKRDKKMFKATYRATRQSSNGTEGYNSLPLSSHGLYSVWIGSDVAGGRAIDGFSINTFEFYKNIIDKANANNGLAIISFHSWSFDGNTEMQELFEQVLEYAVANSKVMRLNDALDIYGNVIETGNVDIAENSYEEHFVASAYGGAKGNRLKTKYAPRDSHNGLHEPSEFEAYATTINQVTTSEARLGGMPIDVGGTLITSKHGDPKISLLYDYQIYIPVNRDFIYKRASDSSGMWGTWIDLSNYVYYDAENTIKAISTYKRGITYSSINKATAASNNLPENSVTGGILKTVKVTSNNDIYMYQEYDILVIGKKFKRTLQSNLTWGNWFDISGYSTIGTTNDNVKAISDFGLGITRSAILTAQSSAMPEGRPGTLETIKLDSIQNGFNYQTYTVYGTERTYKRSFSNEGIPRSWMLVSGILTGTTAQRPTVNLFDGLEYKDVTLKKTVTYYGGSWYDESATVV